MAPQPPQSPVPAPPPAPNRIRPWPLVAAAVALALLLAAGGATAWLLWADRPGGGETVELRLGDGTDTVSPGTVDRVSAILHQRVASLGAGEPVVTPRDDSTVTVELPPDTDVREAVALLERPGVMAVHPVFGTAGSTAQSAFEDEKVLADPGSSEALRLGPAGLGNEQVASAGAGYNSSFGQWEVHVEFTEEGAREWARVTGEAACRPAGDAGRRIAIVVDEEIVSAPEVGPDVDCGTGLGGRTTVISGDFDRAEAEALADLVGSDPLPVAVSAVP
ncbi:Protein translocase subunit SecD [Nocardiopsis dassonvillei]|uniref:preprotein translocase subunit SecD n=1 Tax=Nocardiopsis dassonvillei TaxID=2014 RepID=UPI003F559A2C